MSNEDHKTITKMWLLYFALLLVVGGCIFVAIANIQWKNGKMWREKAEKREESLRRDPAQRGNIYSSDGKILATTIPVCDLYLDLGRWAKHDENGRVVRDTNDQIVIEAQISDSNFLASLDEVCQLLHESVPSKSASYFRDKLLTERSKEKPGRCFLVQRGISYSAWNKICSMKGWNAGVVKSVGEKNGSRSVIRPVRAHIYGNLGENVIGFQNSWESETYTGLEGYYDSLLRGQDGMFLCHRLTKGVWLTTNDGTGHRMTEEDSVTVDSATVQRKINGFDIVSTIDTRFQDIAESSLRRTLHAYGGNSGCAILMEMSTGYVLACSNLTYDTSEHEYREKPNSNWAVSDIYEPGSTFKTIILTAMLNDPGVKIDTSMQLRVGFKNFGGKDGEIKDDHTLAGRDTLSLKEVIEQSSNVGMSELGWQLYRDRRDTLRTLVERMFPYDKLHVDLNAGEYNARINNLNASKRDFLNFCYGYSTVVSPMQLITFYNALGAGGRMVKPLFCKEIIEGDKHTPVQPVVLNEQVCSRESAAIMKDLLMGVVEHGTGNNIKNNTYGIAGKTGTAIYYGTKKTYNGSFAGFFPAENPKYTCLVVIKRSPAYGRQAALVFKAISDCVVALDKEMGNARLENSDLRAEGNGADNAQASAAKYQLPHAVKANQAELMRAYNKLQLPYYSADSNSYWTLWDSCYQGYRMPQGMVPDCKGMTAKDAVKLLHDMGLQVKLQGCGRVAQQEPKARTPIREGNTVWLRLENRK